jgi:Set1/Ash2 histone methyltransferase complex subunit ASH2
MPPTDPRYGRAGEAADAPVRASKKPRAAAPPRAAAAAAAELVVLGAEVDPGSERLIPPAARPARLSAEALVAGMELAPGRLGAASRGGYRTARATHGAHTGTWYFEVTLGALSATGAARLGWITRAAELDAPAGADAHGFCTRSADGARARGGRREPYGVGFRSGDVVGCLLHLPPGGRPLEAGHEDAVTYGGKVYWADNADGARGAPARPLPGSFAGFAVNGAWQGVAFRDLLEGTYFPALSLYTHAAQAAPAEAAVNLGGAPWAHAPPQVEGAGAPRGIAELGACAEG